MLLERDGDKRRPSEPWEHIPSLTCPQFRDDRCGRRAASSVEISSHLQRFGSILSVKLSVLSCKFKCTLPVFVSN